MTRVLSCELGDLVERPPVKGSACRVQPGALADSEGVLKKVRALPVHHPQHLGQVEVGVDQGISEQVTERQVRMRSRRAACRAPGTYCRSRARACVSSASDHAQAVADARKREAIKAEKCMVLPD